MVEAKVAREIILAGQAPDNLVVDGSLDLSGKRDLNRLPAGLKCYELDASNTNLVKLPSVDVECGINLSGCNNLTTLPAGLKTGTLELQGCNKLVQLPERLDVWYLDVSGCSSLMSLPKQALLGKGDLNLAGCLSLRKLPEYLGRVSTLNISDCPLIDHLPDNIDILLWLDVGGSGLTGLPKTFWQIGLRWRGVPVSYRIAFKPETIKAGDVLEERNAERRRVMIERMGNQRFMKEANAKRLDRDKDPGGVRELLRVPLENDEDIVCLSCICPSTQRHYLLRVPPDIKSCHQAAAWIAGFDDPKKYKPVIET